MSSDSAGAAAWQLRAATALAIRYDRQSGTVSGLLYVACCLICVRYLQRAEAEAS